MWIEPLRIAFCFTVVAAIMMPIAIPLPSLCQEQSGTSKSKTSKSPPAKSIPASKVPASKISASSSVTARTSAASALLQANALKKSGDYSKAIAVLTSSTKAFPTSKELYLELGNCLIHERRLNDALLNANTAINKCSPTAAIYRQRGNANYMLHDYPNALKDLDQACKMSPPSAEDYFTRANCFSNAGSSKAVIENLNSGLKLDPKNAEAYFLRAKTYKILNQNALSEADFAKAMSLEK
jgi:tetratricopeptide (TPR) repeat protein